MNTRITDKTNLEWTALRYLTEELSPAEISEFESQLANNPEAAAALSRVLTIEAHTESAFAAIGSATATHDASVASQVNLSCPPTSVTASPQRIGQFVTFAASVAACLLVGSLLRPLAPINDGETLVAESAASGELIESWLDAAGSVELVDPESLADFEPTDLGADNDPIELAMVDLTDTADPGSVPDWMLYAAFQTELEEGEAE